MEIVFSVAVVELNHKIKGGADCDEACKLYKSSGRNTHRDGDK